MREWRVRTTLLRNRFASTSLPTRFQALSHRSSSCLGDRHDLHLLVYANECGGDGDDNVQDTGLEELINGETAYFRDDV
jgi:hypothetical protein